MQRKMFNYNAENNNNYNSDSNIKWGRADKEREGERETGKKREDKRYAAGGGGKHLAAAAAVAVAAGARVNHSRRHISKWRRLIDISADYFMATHKYIHTHTHTHVYAYIASGITH